MAKPIPVVDIAAFDHGGVDERGRVVDEVTAACEQTGFLVVTGHDVSAALVEEIYETSAEFFALPLPEKEGCTPEGWDRYCGFASIATGQVGKRPPDYKEMFHVNRFDGPDEALAAGYPSEVAAAQAPNIWPERPAGFAETWRRYYGAMEVLADRMDRIFATCLGLEERWFAGSFDRHLSNLSANWYPPQVVPPVPGQVRSQAHVDFSMLTILYQDDAPGGLEVRDRSGEWRPVAPLAGSFVVNIGDLMDRYTNNRWQATPHRVVNPSRHHAERGRISIPYFQMPNWDAVIECVPTCRPATGEPRYQTVVAGPHAEERRAGKRPQMVV
jgi:isopenicillin N synthase-like dioxygenase